MRLVTRPDLEATLLASIGNITSAFSNRSPVFFPEYTDHSTRHFEEVLETADALISESAIPQEPPTGPFTPEDAAVLAIAVFLHDIGMHLTEEGFFYLVSGERGVCIPELDHISWPEAWQEFWRESRRWDGRTLERMFGTPEPISRRPDRKDDLDLRDRLLIGEFLRRNHARLAHEAAVFGFPGPTRRLTLLSNPPTPEFADLTGLVARSHGLPLRSAVEYLAGRYHPRTFQGIHAVYLMAVIRIADYLQVQASRAPYSRLAVTGLRSPVSRGEWKAHDCVRSISYSEDDPEAVFIHAAPTDVRTFLRMEALLDGLQSELDMAWAVLGEKYGRDQKLARLTLTLRRVRSNLDDTKRFASQVRYVPKSVAIKTAASDLLTLLVQPLYGDNVDIAIRELIQNAVDACLERQHLLDKVGGEKKEGIPRGPLIKIHLDQTSAGWFFSISDCGVGMTAEILEEYFLNAGASFRTSDAWQLHHISESQHSEVLRSGRFGIGVLAAFLLGPRIEVSTRHVFATEDSGIHFTVAMTDDLVEMLRQSRPVGTTIRIHLTASMGRRLANALTRSAPQFGQLPDQVYLFAKPRIGIFLNGKRVKFGLRWPRSANETQPTKWHRLQVPDYEAVDWAFFRESGRVACNGLAVGVLGWRNDNTEGIRFPNVSVLDPDARLPLTLTRTALIDGKLPFEQELHEAVLRDIVSWILVQETEPLIADGYATLIVDYIKHPGLIPRQAWPTYVFTDEGATLFFPSYLRPRGINTIIRYLTSGKRLVAWPIPAGAGLVCAPMRRAMSRHTLRVTDKVTHTQGYLKHLRGCASRVVLPRHREVGLDSPSDLVEEDRGEDWVCFRTKHVGERCVDLDSVGRLLRRGSVDAVIESYLNLPTLPETRYPWADERLERPFLAVIERYLGQDLLLPYDVTERRRKFSSAFLDLAVEIKKSEDFKQWHRGRRERRTS